MEIEGERLTVREVQMVELDILKRVARLLEERGIHSLLSGGTLLGAIRHNGFIPWDDDIDIFVPRNDYERLKDVIVDMGRTYEGVVFALPGDEGSPFPFIKAYDPMYLVREPARDEEFQSYAWVDIFPLDHFPDSKIAHRWWLAKIVMPTKVLNAGTYSKGYMASRGYSSNLVKRIMFAGSLALYRLMGGYRKITMRIDRTAHGMDTKFKSSNHVGDGAWPNGIKDYYELRCVEPVMSHRFEDTEFNVPVNYDAYLTTFYGDWERVPPEEERITHHVEVYKVSQ